MSSVTAVSTTSTSPAPPELPPELPPEATMYRALCERDADFLGLFVAGVRTTGIVCLPTCPARKPRPENVVYFATTADALHAGYRACKRCRPLDAPQRASAVVERLLAAVDAHPDQPLRAAELRAMGIEPATARRHFRARFGMSFAAYARARRLGHGVRELRAGSDVIEGQLAAGFASGSGFREALLRDLGHPPRDARQPALLLARFFDTPLGAMLALAEDGAGAAGIAPIVLLKFVARKGLAGHLVGLRRRLGAAILPGDAVSLDQLERELVAYFAGARGDFDIPLRLHGTAFQQRVWRELCTIPAGHTISYKDLAERVGRPGAARAVARANASNRLALLVPCHRVVAADGGLAGYAAGVARKAWLLDHERRTAVEGATRRAPSRAGSASV